MHTHTHTHTHAHTRTPRTHTLTHTHTHHERTCTHVHTNTHSTCPICDIPFGEASFVRYPNGVTTHHKCSRERSVCPLTGKWFQADKVLPSNWMHIGRLDTPSCMQLMIPAWIWVWRVIVILLLLLWYCNHKDCTRSRFMYQIAKHCSDFFGISIFGKGMVWRQLLGGHCWLFSHAL